MNGAQGRRGKGWGRWASLLCGQTVNTGLLDTEQTRKRLKKLAGKVVMGVKDLLRLTDLFKGLQYFLSLTKMSEEKL